MHRPHDYRYRLVDVFTQEPFQGNQLAVFPDPVGMSEQDMQLIARELNLPETTFVLPASDRTFSAQVRIFTPGKEMLFAGHPTLGIAYVLIDEGRIPHSRSEFSLDEKIGPVLVRVDRSAEGML